MTCPNASKSGPGRSVLPVNWPMSGKTGSGDHGDVDLIMKRSTDGGRTWSPHRIVHEEGGEAKITIGNPCPVVDSKTGSIWLPFTRDNKAVFITSSTDDGQTWSAPRNLSATTMKPDWDWVATGPGIGIQLTRGKHAGRLVIPSDHKRTLAGKQLEWNSHMMFSDDGGATWQISAPISAGGNECQVIERADGSLLVNTRMQGGWEGWRGIATSTDGGATWAVKRQDTNLGSVPGGAAANSLAGTDTDAFYATLRHHFELNAGDVERIRRARSTNRGVGENHAHLLSRQRDEARENEPLPR